MPTPPVRPAGVVARLRAAPLAARAALAMFPLTVVADVVAVLTDWRGRFDVPPDQGSVASGYALAGSAVSAPVLIVILMIAAALLAMRVDRWRIVGLVLIAVTGVFVTIGGLGELVADPSEHTPQAVLVVSGSLYTLLGLSYVVLAVRDLRNLSRRSGAAPLRRPA